MPICILVQLIVAVLLQEGWRVGSCQKKLKGVSAKFCTQLPRAEKNGKITFLAEVKMESEICK